MNTEPPLYEVFDPRSRTVKVVAALLLAIVGFLLLFYGPPRELFFDVSPADRVPPSIGKAVVTLVTGGLGLVFLNVSLMQIWRAFSVQPIVVASQKVMRFHPSVFLGALSYEEVEKWTAYPIKGPYIMPGRWEMKIRLKNFYWSPGSIILSRTIKIEAAGDTIDGLVQFLIDETQMWQTLFLTEPSES